jgi:hypothetical protein
VACMYVRACVRVQDGKEEEEAARSCLCIGAVRLQIGLLGCL